MSKRILFSAFGLYLCACADGNDHGLSNDQNAAVAEEDGTAWLTISTPIVAGELCAHGGQRTDVGVDLDSSGTLEGSEIRSAYVQCAGEEPAPHTPEPEVPDAPAKGDIVAALDPCAALDVTAPTTPEQLFLAVDGPGYLVFEGAAGSAANRLYARDAAIMVTPNGTLADGRGLALLGYPEDEHGVLDDGKLARLTIAVRALSATATSVVRVSANLNSNSSVVGSWDPSHPANTSNFSTSVPFFDSLGSAHQATVYFAKTSSDTWSYHVMVDYARVVDSTSGAQVEVAGGTLTFTTDGALLSHEAAPSTWTSSFAPDQNTVFDFGHSVSEGGNGYDGTTTFAAPSSLYALDQDGFSAGSVVGIDVDQFGAVRAQYSNDQQRSLGVLALARLPVDRGFSPLCGSLWTDSGAGSSDPVLGAAGTGGRGLLVAQHAK